MTARSLTAPSGRENELRIWVHPFAEMNMLHFPLLVLKGIYDYWTYFLVFSRGLKQMIVRDDI